MPYVIEALPPGADRDADDGGWLPYLALTGETDDATRAREERDALERDRPGWRGRVQWVDEATFDRSWPSGSDPAAGGRLRAFLAGFRDATRRPSVDGDGYDGSASTVRAHPRRGTRGVRRHTRRRPGGAS